MFNDVMTGSKECKRFVISSLAHPVYQNDVEEEAKLTRLISLDSGFHQQFHPLSDSELLIKAGPMRYTQLVCGRYGTHISNS